HRRHMLYRAHFGRGLTLMKQERRDEARPAWQRVVELTEGQSEITMRQGRPMPLAYLGEHARAAAEMEALLRGTLEATVRYDSACAYGTSAQVVVNDAQLAAAEKQQLAERYAVRAVELLTQIHAAGYFAAPHRGAKSLKRWEFDPLRERPDFQRLL